MLPRQPAITFNVPTGNLPHQQINVAMQLDLNFLVFASDNFEYLKSIFTPTIDATHLTDQGAQSGDYIRCPVGLLMAAYRKKNYAHSIIIKGRDNIIKAINAAQKYRFFENESVATIITFYENSIALDQFAEKQDPTIDDIETAAIRVQANTVSRTTLQDKFKNIIEKNTIGVRLAEAFHSPMHEYFVIFEASIRATKVANAPIDKLVAFAKYFSERAMYFGYNDHFTIAKLWAETNSFEEATVHLYDAISTQGKITDAMNLMSSWLALPKESPKHQLLNSALQYILRRKSSVSIDPVSGKPITHIIIRPDETKKLLLLHLKLALMYQTYDSVYNILMKLPAMSLSAQEWLQTAQAIISDEQYAEKTRDLSQAVANVLPLYIRAYTEAAPNNTRLRKEAMIGIEWLLEALNDSPNNLNNSDVKILINELLGLSTTKSLIQDHVLDKFFRLIAGENIELIFNIDKLIRLLKNASVLPMFKITTDKSVVIKLITLKTQLSDPDVNIMAALRIAAEDKQVISIIRQFPDIHAGFAKNGIKLDVSHNAMKIATDPQ